MEWLNIFAELAKTVGPTTALLGGIAYIIWTKMPARSVQEADADGKVGAIEAYKQLLSDERAARKEAELRADEFAKERNEANKQMYELKTQLVVLTRQMEEQKVVIEQLTDELRQLKEKLHAS
jgi:chromosome segregation ATPase